MQGIRLITARSGGGLSFGCCVWGSSILCVDTGQGAMLMLLENW